MSRKRIANTVSLILLTCIICTTCDQASSTPANTKYKTVLIKDVPHVRQRPDFCGEACVAMVLQKLGHPTTQEHIFNLAGVDPALGRGCIIRDMETVLKRIGFRSGMVWNKINPKKAATQIEDQFKLLLADLQKETPSIVCMHYGDSPKASEHFRLILGYDTNQDEVIYHEPAETKGAYKRMKRSLFLKLWPLKYKKTEWLIIRMPMKVGKIKLGQPARGFTNTDFAQHVMKLKSKLPKGFSFVIQPPFVVIGDESPARVKLRAEQTVKWFCNHVEKRYFSKAPRKIYDIWLFKDKASYRKYTKQIFNDTPTTPYGYCSDAHGALIMNIATGGGTLCHEIVHAYIDSNFPRCPSWFNEGLASLYEQCGARGGRLVGFTNWRLAGLQQEIRAGTLPSFQELLTTTSWQFYNMTNGNNYAQARYLCYYLQEQNLLTKYYQEFTRNAKNDPSGYETLKIILDETDITDFQKRWEKWILTLRYP
jgi:predicted double-glycine peptidase